MPKVGRFVTDPGAGAYCQITLDSGEKVIVNHDKSGLKGGLLTIEVSKFMGFSADRIWACNLDSPAGQDVLAWLTRGATPGSLAASPLGAAVEFVRESGTLQELRTRCAALMRSR
ncbi:MAG TPA: hypothetical protein VFR53_07405 [Methylomirabilota bacterium]|nr:hypothetical protein [Methylomirabilota bacterium]